MRHPLAVTSAPRHLPRVLALVLAVGLGLVDAFGRAGAVVAGQALAPWSGWLVAAALLLAACVVPPRPLGVRRGLPLGVAFVLLLAGWWQLDRRLADLPRAELPLTGTLRPLDGAPAQPVAVPLATLWKRHRLAQTFGRSGGFDLDVQGRLVTPEAGRYRLELRCPETCSVWLDGHEVLTVPGRPAAEIALTAGVQPLRLRQRAEGRAFLRLTWHRPAWLAMAPLEEAAGAGASLAVFRARERSAWRLALGMGLVWAAVALVALRLAAAVAGWRPRFFALVRRRWSQPAVRRALAVAILTAAAVTVLRGVAARGAPDGLHVHAWTGEYMMQVVSAADLKVEPLRSLVYLHIQPPALDALRALLVQRHLGLDGLALLDAVDRDLYAVWAVAAGLLAALVYLWLHALLGATPAAAGTALFVLHPAFLFYATFLDSTFVSGAGVAWVTYELWRLARGPGSPGRLALAVSLLFLTRSVVQWPFVAVLAAAVGLLGIDRRRALRVFVPVLLVMGLYMAKQYALFGLTVTSSFGPDSFCKGLSAYCHGYARVEVPELPPPGAASVLRRTEKLNGEYNWNQLAFLRRSFSQMEEYKELLRATPPRRLVELVAHTVTIWLRPSSRHSPHVLADALPWRGAYDAVFSGVALVLLLVGSGAAALFAGGFTWAKARRALALALPALYVAAVTIVFESGENMRYKFFVEPLIWVLVATQVGLLAGAVRRRLHREPHLRA